MSDENLTAGDQPAEGEAAFEVKPLSSILDRAPREEREPPAGEQAGEKQPVEQKAEGEPPEGTEAKPDGKDGKPPSSDDEGPKNWAEARKALKDAKANEKAERQAREALQRQVEELTRKVMQPPQQAQEQPEIPDPIVDPAGYRQYIADQSFVERAELTRELMVDAVGEEKFTAAEAAFIQAVEANPKLAQQLRAAANPAKFAFQQGTKLLEQKAAADPKAAADKLRAELKAEIMAELGLKPTGTAQQGNNGQQQGTTPQTQQRSAPVTPTSLADARSTGSHSAPVWAGPKPLSALLKRK